MKRAAHAALQGATGRGRRKRSDRATGFPPVARHDARVLVLGSMPGRASLAAGQYYAHPRNAFWPLMQDLFAQSGDLDYPRRLAMLGHQRVALWDVLRACHRKGSLDAAIDPRTATANDFESFFARHPDIRAVFFNGQAAAAHFRRHVAPGLPAGHLQRIETTTLPSTSPALTIRFEAKRRAWVVVREAAKV